MKRTWIIDSGHGGMLNGQYTTAPAKMHIFPDLRIYEGVINRGIAHKLRILLNNAKIEFMLVYDEDIDTPLGIRVQRANKIHSKYKNGVLLSIHSNAGGGEGIEVFTSIGQTESDKLAEVFCQEYKKQMPEFKFRQDQSDGDADKESDFYVLRNTSCPAVLVESLFFDNLREAHFLASEEGQTRIAHVLYTAIKRIEDENY